MNQTNESGLMRGIRRWDLVAVAINGIIGAGIFGLPSEVFSRTGPYSLLAFAICAIVVSLIVLCFAEVGSRTSETGGPYLYARLAFGAAFGFEVGWLMWIARLTAFAANCNLLVDYLGFFLPQANIGVWRAALVIAVTAAITVVNVAGVRDAAIASNLFTIGKLIPIILFIAVGLFFIDPSSFSFSSPPGYKGFSSSVLILVYAFTGFEMAVIPAGEVEDPRRNLPLALITAMAVVAVTYILIQVVCIGTLPELAASKRPLADASSHFLGAAGGSIISAGALVSITGNLIVIVLAASRLPFAMAERGELPRLFASTHSRFRTPHVAILATAGVMLMLTLSGTFVYAVTISAIARLLAYAATCAALIRLRKRSDAPQAMFKAPGGVVIALASMLLAAWLLSNSTLQQARDALIASAAGIAVYLAYRLSNRRPRN